MKHPSNSSGQALLLVVLGMAVVLVVVLSVLSGSITDVKISGREDESLRAFSAAEAGVEKQLIASSTNDITGSFANSASFSTVTASFGGGANFFNYPNSIASGESATLWLVSHATDGTLICDGTHPCFTGSKIKVCWGKAGTPNNVATTPAIEASLYYSDPPVTTDYSNIKIARTPIDANAGRVGTNFFASADVGSCTIGSATYTFQKTIDLSAAGLNIPATSYTKANGLQMLKVRMIYNTDVAQTIGMDVNFAENLGSTLPSQGSQIDSTGTSGNSTRKVEVVRLYADLPPTFDAAVFSPVTLSK